MENKKSMDRFCQGYLCAVSTLILKHGEVKPSTKELFQSLGGGYNIKLWRQWGVDEQDIEILKKYRKHLI